MPAKLKPKVSTTNDCSKSVLCIPILAPIFIFVLIIMAYFACKISQLNDYSADSGYFLTVDSIKSLVGLGQRDTTLSYTELTFYTEIWRLILEDITYLQNIIHNIVGSLLECVKGYSTQSHTGLVAVVITSAAVIVSFIVCVRKTGNEKKTRRKKEKGQETRKNCSENGKKPRHTSGDCCQDNKSAAKITSKRGVWRWLTALMLLSFLLSLPWEFVRLYQSMVAESVAQMKTGMPAECMPDQMSVSQTLRAWLRWQFSWGQDPCLLYHKALLVDPIWQVSPLMVISSAFSHCVVYPVEVLFGGLGRAFRLFFAEIPSQWQPVMLVVMVTMLILVLTMVFGYRIHLPFLIKFEPKTPVFLKLMRRRRPVEAVEETEKKTLSFSDSVTSSQESEYSLYTSSQTSQSQSIDY